MADFPYAPEDVAVELWLNGAWVDVAAAGRVRLSDGVRIRRGKSSGSTGLAQPQSQSCEFTLESIDGAFSPDNPLSPYYGSFGQGTPVRVATRVAKSSFSGTASNGFATPERGGTWGVTGTASRYSESSGAGKIAFTAANQTGEALQTNQTYASHDVAVTFTFPFSNVTGAEVGAGVVLGQLTGTDQFLARLRISAAEVMTVDVIHELLGYTIATPVTITDFAFTGQAIRMRAQLAGQTIRVRVWPAASAEPSTWHAEGAIHAFSDLLDRPKGHAGLWGLANTGNTNVPFTISYDNWEVRSNRYAGSVAALTAQSDTSGRDVTVRVECGGPRRRLSQGQPPVYSPLRRVMSFELSPPNLLYYPMEDESSSSQAASGLPNQPPMIQPSGTNLVQFASNTTFPGSKAVLAPNGGRLFAPPIVGAAATGVMQALFCFIPPGDGSETNGCSLLQLQLTGTCAYIDVRYATASSGSIYLEFYDAAKTSLGTSPNLVTSLNGVPSLISVELTQSGSDISYQVAQYPINSTVGASSGSTLTGRTIGAPQGVYVAAGGQVLKSAIGHVALRNAIQALFTFQNSLNAYSFPDMIGFEPYTETSLARAQRLLDAAGIEVSAIRRPGVSHFYTNMGLQPLSGLMALLDETAKVELATLYEDRDVEGFVFRYGRSKFNQDAVLTLDISAGQLAPPFAMPKDDQSTINIVEAKRESGSSIAVRDDASVAVKGEYATSESFRLWTDRDLADRAYWLLHLGLDTSARYPSMELNLARAASKSTQLYLDMLAFDIDDRIVATNPNAAIISADLDLIGIGYAEVLKGMEHTITVACTPGGPWAVAEAATISGDTNPWLGRADTSDSQVNTSASAGATTLSVKTNSGPLWTTVADNFPLYLNVGGIQVRATACSGSSSPQTFTVDALPAARAAGLSVSVWHLPVLAF
ncbi:hypothetical protein [Amycolatopsis sp. NPDC004378]